MTARIPTAETLNRLQPIVEQAWNCLRAHEWARSSKVMLTAAYHKHMPFLALAFGLVLTPIWAAMVAWIPARDRLVDSTQGF